MRVMTFYSDVLIGNIFSICSNLMNRKPTNAGGYTRNPPITIPVNLWILKSLEYYWSVLRFPEKNYRNELFANFGPVYLMKQVKIILNGSGELHEGVYVPVACFAQGENSGWVNTLVCLWNIVFRSNFSKIIYGIHILPHSRIESLWVFGKEGAE